MPFDQYRSFELSLMQAYGPVYKRYPYAMFFLDHLLRLHFRGSSEFYNFHVKQMAHASRFLSISRVIYCRIAPFWHSLIRAERILFLANEFPVLERISKQYCVKRNLSFCSASPAALRFWDLIGGKYFSPVAILKAKTPNRTLCLIEKLGVDSFIRNDQEMKKFDDLCKNNVRSMQDILRSSRTRLVLATGDNWSWLRLVCESAKLAGIPYVVVAHGYIQDPALVTIAPIRATKLLVWTKKQEEELKKSVFPRERATVDCIGWPKSSLLERGSVGIGDVLFCSEPFFFLTKKRYLSIVRRLAEITNSVDRRFVLRLHPKDRPYEEQIWASLPSFIRRSAGTLEDDLKRADVAVGSNSSALVEAYYTGVNAIQVKELKKIDIEYTVTLGVDEFETYLLRSLKEKREAVPKGIQEEEFSRFVDGICREIAR